MTSLPSHASDRKLGLVIDLDICVGCHACAVNCKEWNSGGHMAPLTDYEAWGDSPSGVWFNRVHSFEAGETAPSFDALNTKLPKPIGDLAYGAEFRERRGRA